MKPPLTHENESAHDYVQRALLEDAAFSDLTSRSVVVPGLQANAQIVSRSKGVISGLTIARITFELLDPNTTFDACVKDGDSVLPGTVIARIRSEARCLLSAERTALNFLGHLSGIASFTALHVQAISDFPNTRIADTRKTTPGIRQFEKQAVLDGGGWSHRNSLSSGILVKENHFLAAQHSWDKNNSFEAASKKAVQEARNAQVPSGIEVENIQEFQIALNAKPDFILLDNMTPELIRQAVEIRGEKSHSPILEVSGGITLDTLPAFAAAGADRISIGGITHSAPNLDLSLLIEEIFEPIHHPTYRYFEVNSTMDQAWKKLSQLERPSGLVVRAERQTHGRGRQGRLWDSRPEMGLWFSYLFTSSERNPMEWTIAVAVGVVRVLGKFLPTSRPLHIKWPNDILIDGRKVCGILAETRSDYPGSILAGIGVNVLHQPKDFPPELENIATSLAQWTHSPPNREDLFSRLIEELDQIAQELESGEFQSIEREWQNASASIGKPIKIQVGKDEIQGTLIRLTLEEGLTLQLENGQEKTFRSEHTILSE